MFDLAAVQTHLALFCNTVHIGENKLGIIILINTKMLHGIYKCSKKQLIQMCSNFHLRSKIQNKMYIPALNPLHIHGTPPQVFSVMLTD